MRLKILLISAALLTGVTATAWADAETAPAAAEAGVIVPRIITAPEVKHMMETTNVLVVHTLSKIEFDIQHIPGSINIPVLDMKDATDLLPADKTQALIFYCMGVNCEYSKKAAVKAIEMGYTQVWQFEGGIPEWRRFNYPMQSDEALANIDVKKLSPEDLKAQMRDPATFVLDVRPLWWEVTHAVIDGATFIPLVKLDKQYRELPIDRPLVVVDGFMKQSPSAARFLISKGYQVVGVLKGGMVRWEKEGYPVVYK